MHAIAARLAGGATVPRGSGPREAWWQPGGPAPERVAPRVGEAREGAASFGALAAFTIVLILAPQTLSETLASLRLALLAALVAAGSHARDCLAAHLPLVRAAPANALAFLLVAWAALTAPLSYWPGGSAALLTDLYLKALVVFWLLGGVLSTSVRLHRLCLLLSLLMLPLAVTALRNYAVGAFLPAGALNRIAGYEAPLTQNPNDLALMLNLVLPLTIALARDARSVLVRVALSAAAGLSGVAIILTFSRGGFLCLACTALGYLGSALRRGRLGWAALGLGCAALGLLCLPQGYATRLSTISNMSADPTLSAQLRWADMLLAARYLAEHPLVGAGIGMNALALNDLRGPAWKEVHNAYLQCGVDLGIPGLLLFVGLMLSCWREARRVERRCAAAGGARRLGLLAQGIRTSLVAFAVAALFHPVAYQFYFFYVGGLAVAAGSIRERELPS